MNHGENWKREADKVFRAFGIRIKRTSSAAEKGVSEATRIPYKPRNIDHSIKYVFRCSCCGQIVRRERASKFTKHPENYRCAACHGKFERVF
jgi:predicted SprT family Zn-dependent metalloprotease